MSVPDPVLPFDNIVLEISSRIANQRRILQKQPYFIERGYNILFLVGRGGFGAVFFGEEPHSDPLRVSIQVALKLVMPCHVDEAHSSTKKRKTGLKIEDARDELAISHREIDILNTINQELIVARTSGSANFCNTIVHLRDFFYDRERHRGKRTHFAPCI